MLRSERNSQKNVQTKKNILKSALIIIINIIYIYIVQIGLSVYACLMFFVFIILEFNLAILETDYLSICTQTLLISCI